MSFYKADPDDNRKQIPKPLGGISSSRNIFSNAITPAENTLTKNPSYIIINTSGSFGFMYTATGSLSAGTVMAFSSASYFITGAVVPAGQTTRLDIQPIAWHRQDAAGTVGDITFIYRGGL